MKLIKKYNRLYETEQDLIHVWGEDENGHIIFEYCDDPTRQTRRMTLRQLLLFEPIWN